MKNFHFLLFAGLLSSFLFFSCKPAQVITEKKKSSELEPIYNNLKSNELNFSTLEIKFAVKYDNAGDGMSLKGNMKILKDSIIWVSLSPGLGIEGARILCYRDSVFIMDRINKKITKSDYNYIKNSKKIDVDFNSIQSILLNELFLYPSVADEKNSFVNDFLIKSDSLVLSVYSKSLTNVESLIQIDKSKQKIGSYMINDIANVRNLTVNYGVDRFSDYSNFPKKISINSNNSGKFLTAELEYTKISVNQELTFAFKVPDNYSVIKH